MAQPQQDLENGKGQGPSAVPRPGDLDNLYKFGIQLLAQLLAEADAPTLAAGLQSVGPLWRELLRSTIHRLGAAQSSAEQPAEQTSLMTPAARVLTSTVLAAAAARRREAGGGKSSSRDEDGFGPWLRLLGAGAVILDAPTAVSGRKRWDGARQLAQTFQIAQGQVLLRALEAAFKAT